MSSFVKDCLTWKNIDLVGYGNQNIFYMQNKKELVSEQVPEAHQY